MKSFILFLLILLLASCGPNTNPAPSDHIQDDRNSSNSVLIFREFKSSLYLVEYGNRKFVTNSNGGVVELKEN